MRSFTENDPIAFLNQYAEGMLLDEVHHAPNLLSYIQGMVDEDTNRRFVLSGSSQFAMLKKITQSLARRTAVFELLPMSCAEIRKTATGTPLDDLLFSGFYPAICSGRNMPKFLYPAYVKTYLDKGTRFAANQGYDAVSYIYPALCRAHRLVIQSLGTGQRDRCQFPHDNGLAAVLQAPYTVTLLPPYFENTRKRLTKTPKLYFMDTELTCHLLGIESPEQLARDKMRGALFENFIVTEALKQRYNMGKESNLYFYRDSNQNEVDLVLKKVRGCTVSRSSRP